MSDELKSKLENTLIEYIRNSTLQLITLINSDNTENDITEPCNGHIEIPVCNGIDILIDYNPSINFTEQKIEN